MGEMGRNHVWEKNDADGEQSRRRRSLSKVAETLTANVDTDIALNCTLHDQSRTGPGTSTAALEDSARLQTNPSTFHQPNTAARIWT